MCTVTGKRSANLGLQGKVPVHSNYQGPGHQDLDHVTNIEIEFEGKKTNIFVFSFDATRTAMVRFSFFLKIRDIWEAIFFFTKSSVTLITNKSQQLPQRVVLPDRKGKMSRLKLIKYQIFEVVES